MSKITILGAGSWGSALAIMLGKMSHDVTLWTVDTGEAEMINNEHQQKQKLPEVIIPNNVTATTDMKKALENSEITVCAVPSIYVRETARVMNEHIKKDSIVLSVSKGIEDVTFKTMTQVIGMEAPNVRLAAMSGPSHAEEVAVGIPTGVVVAGKEQAVAEKIQDTFMNSHFRIYSSSDLMGVELGGSLKNVIALAAGMADGIGCGDNTKAALITRGMAEIARLGIRMGGKIDTFYGMSGIGDLIVTCGSRHSRNYRAGFLIGQGHKISKVQEEVGMVIEGLNTARAAANLAKRNAVEMPIIAEVNNIVFLQKDPKDSVEELMTREKKTEISFMP